MVPVPIAYSTPENAGGMFIKIRIKLPKLLFECRTPVDTAKFTLDLSILSYYNIVFASLSSQLMPQKFPCFPRSSVFGGLLVKLDILIVWH